MYYLLRRIATKYATWLERRPVPTKLATAICLTASCDAISQCILEKQQKYSPRRAASLIAVNASFVPVLHYWFDRLEFGIIPRIGQWTERAAASKSPLTRSITRWVVPFTTRKAALCKVLFDQGLYSPINLCTYTLPLSSTAADACCCIVAVLVIGASTFLNQSGGAGGVSGAFEIVKRKLRHDFLPTLAASYVVWPAAQMINFSYIPLPYRVLWCGAIGFAWTIYLSAATFAVPTSSALHHKPTLHPHDRN